MEFIRLPHNKEYYLKRERSHLKNKFVFPVRQYTEHKGVINIQTLKIITPPELIGKRVMMKIEEQK